MKNAIPIRKECPRHIKFAARYEHCQWSKGCQKIVKYITKGLCHTHYCAQWRLDNPRDKEDQMRRALDASRRKRFGIGNADVEQMLAMQNGKCAICMGKNKGRRCGWCVDHNHKTGKVRGILCGDCNKGIGCLKDSIFILGSAITYLREHQE